MTYCELAFKSLKRRIEEGKTIKQIGKELCPEVKHPEDKVIRMIKLYYGKDAPKILANPDLEYNQPHNPTGKNYNNEPEFSGSKSRPRPKISLGRLAKRVLDETRRDYRWRNGKKLSYSDAIWLLWVHADIPEEQRKL